MIYDLLAPAQGPRGGAKNTVVRPIHVSNSHTKFDWIASNGLRGESVTDGRTDGRKDGDDCNIPTLFIKRLG